MHHVYIDGPLIGKGLTCISKCRHIIRWTKFCQDGHPLSVLLFTFQHFVPPGKMSFYCIFPLRCAGIIHLWSFGMTNSCMDMFYTIERHIYCFSLVLQHTFMHITPVRYIECD